MAIPSWYQAQISTTILAPTTIVNDIKNIIVSTIIGSTIQTNILNVNTLSSSTIQTNTLTITTLLGSTIQTNVLNVPMAITSSTQSDTLLFNTVFGNTIQANVLQYSTIIGNAIQSNFQDAKIIVASNVQSNELNISTMIGNNIQTNTTNVSSIINNIIITPIAYVSSVWGSTIQTKLVIASTVASDNAQLNNLFVSTLIGSTIIGTIFQINASNISSAIGNTVQTNTLQTNIPIGSTVQTNLFIVSTINITSTNIIPMNTLNTAIANGSTIMCSTIQTNNVGLPKSLVGIFGEYLTLDLGTSGNYHNQYSHWIRTYATVKKINFVGSNDGINWTNLGISAGTIVNVPGVGNRHFFNYTSTNVRYLRIIFIEIQNYSLYGFQLGFGESIISNDGESYGYSYSISLASLFPRSFDNILLSPNISLDSSYISNFTINVNGTYSPQSPYTTGYYNGNLATMVPDPNSVSYTIGILTTSTIQTNLLYSNVISCSTIQTNTLQVDTLLGSTIINSTIQTNTMNVSSFIGSTIQVNTLLGNTILVSTIQTNQINTSSILTSTALFNNVNTNNVIGSSIQTNQMGVSTITRSTIQMNTLNANMNVITNTNFNISGEYITYDLGVSDVYHNRLSMYDYSNLGFAYLYKIHVVGSDDNNTWISFGVSIVTLLTDPNKFEYYYTLNNKRYLRLIILEVYNTVPDATYTKLYFNGGWVNYYNDPVAIANNQEIPDRRIYGVDISPGLIIYRTEFISEYYIDSYLYSPTTYNTIGYYTGSLITNAASNINTITTTFANTAIGSTIQSDVMNGGTLQVSTLSGSTIISNIIQTPQMNISTILGSSIIGNNLQPNRILITDGNKALSSSVIPISQLSYITGLTSQAAGIGQNNTWTSTNIFNVAPIFSGLSTSVQLNTLGMSIDGKLVKHNMASGITGSISTNYIPYAEAISTLTNSIIYRVNSTDLAIGQTTSAFPTGTGTTLSVAGLTQTSTVMATTASFSKIYMADKRNGLNGLQIPNQGCNFYMGTMNNNGSGNYSDVLCLNSWYNRTASTFNTTDSFNVRNNTVVTSAGVGFVTMSSFTTSTTGLTISACIILTGSSRPAQWARIFDMGNLSQAPTRGFLVAFNTNGTLTCHYRASDGTIAQLITTIQLVLNKMYHVLWTVDTSGNHILYINGEQAATATKVITVDTYPYFYLGKSNWSADPYPNMTLFDFRMINRPLSLTDVLQLYEFVKLINQGSIINGQYIVLTRPTNGCFNLSEIRVYSYPGGPNIITPSTTVTMSNPASGVPNSNFVDGNLDNYMHNDCGQAGPLTVDLGSMKPIYKIVIYNRKYCCQQRANGTILTIRNSSNTIIYTANPMSDKLGRTTFGETTFEQTNTSDYYYTFSYFPPSAAIIGDNNEDVFTNIVMFDKSNIGMRIFQAENGVSINNTSYKDAVMTDNNSGNITLGQSSDSIGITFGPDISTGNYLRIGSGPNRIGTNISQIITTNGNLHLDCATNTRSIKINASRVAATTFMYSPVNMINIAEQPSMGLDTLVLCGDKVHRSRVACIPCIRENAIGWGGGVNAANAFYKYNTKVVVRIIGRYSYWRPGGGWDSGQWTTVKLKVTSATSGAEITYTFDTWVNSQGNHITHPIDIVLNESVIPWTGWYHIYIYGHSNIYTDSYDQLHVYAIMLPGSEY